MKGDRRHNEAVDGICHFLYVTTPYDAKIYAY
jgi:hypothetical protein